MILLIFLAGLLCVAFTMSIYAANELHKKLYNSTEVSDKFFLLDTWNGNKCIIEVIEKFEKNGTHYIVVKNNNNRYQYTCKQFATEVLVKNNRFYYEKLNNESLKNITEKCED